ncbi:homeobox-domain-containing protein [Annulohypoxylon maeteangense]|uniref:homeobox-domain-containing protein n=1 Tax=Annulohypoxylon maeteangense TaxID=1927788 RepID=UPI0020072849|nr:homeobox-domain-containing protein [Annulohypoxylon maeteangense]KAI0883070.1 homeobox-domain-containing protein [Annulohypoxylon maeteangense]
MMETPIKMEQPGSAAPTIAAQTHSTPEAISTPANSVDTKDSMSPSPSSAQSATQSSANSRRPPRKSTLTQQQKNQKRQRATQDQLTTLEMEFNKNPTPTANVRERIAEEINMTERSVQIWFQNRRAKIKLLAKKSLETGEDIDSIPESMRAYLAMQAMESGKGLGGPYMGRTGLLPYGSMMLGGEQGGQGKVLIHHLTCRSLSIGKWTRVGQNTMDLIIFYSPEKCTMTYYINNDQAGYKIEYNFNAIKNIYLENPEGDATKLGGIVIELNRPPNFFMDSSPNSNGFFQCNDFTEDQQATHCLVHHLGGNPKVLSGQLAKLASLESFTNRHNPNPFDMSHALSVSAPVSPTNRPASQPNFGPPHVGMYQESQWGINPMHAGMRAPGHKRQRSRSVPTAVDFSMFQNPMPSFYIQHPGDNQTQPHSPNIYAPIPQQPNGLNNVGPNLRIDTQASYGMDLRQYPLSAATTAPSEYSSPNFFSQGPENTPLPASSFGTPYGGAFLSPLPQIPQSVSPLSYTGHGDPAIVEQSPPLSMLQRPASADIYGMGESAISDDGHGLNEMYSKHTINLPMHSHSPGFMEANQADLDMNQLVQFDTVDPSSLSPESIQHHQ